MDEFDGVLVESLGRAARLLVALVLALPIAWNRERQTRRLGLRTFPLVSVASCSYALIGISVAEGDPNAAARLLQGLVTGIGFVGGGAILRSGDDVHGTSTAAAIWATGAVGATVGFGRFDLAVAVAGMTFLTFLVLTPVGRQIKSDPTPPKE